jgi:hypothetical protein
MKKLDKVLCLVKERFPDASYLNIAIDPEGMETKVTFHNGHKDEDTRRIGLNGEPLNEKEGD